MYQPQSQLYEDFLPAVLFIAPSSFHFSVAGSRQLSADALGSCDHLGTSGKSFPAFGSSSSHQLPALQESSCIGGQS